MGPRHTHLGAPNAVPSPVDNRMHTRCSIHHTMCPCGTAEGAHHPLRTSAANQLEPASSSGSASAPAVSVRLGGSGTAGVGAGSGPPLPPRPRGGRSPESEEPPPPSIEGSRMAIASRAAAIGQASTSLADTVPRTPCVRSQPPSNSAAARKAHLIACADNHALTTSAAAIATDSIQVPRYHPAAAINRHAPAEISSRRPRPKLPDSAWFQYPSRPSAARLTSAPLLSPERWHGSAGRPVGASDARAGHGGYRRSWYRCARLSESRRGRSAPAGSSGVLPVSPRM